MRQEKGITLEKNWLVSVIIPTYNRGYCIERAINSVLSQSYAYVEIIVVDDGSTDNTAQIAKRFRSRFTYVYKAHEGQATARNAGLKIAKGHVIASLDSDDYWHPNFLELCVNWLQQYNLDVFIANWVSAPPDFSLDKFVPQLLHQAFYAFNYAEFRQLLIQGINLPSSALLFKKESLPQSGWNPAMYIADDTCLLFDTLIHSTDKRVGLTSLRLWTKCLDETNICHGREGYEFRLNVASDFEQILVRVSDKLNAAERELLTTRILQNKLLALARSFSYRDKAKLLMAFNLTKSLLSNPILTIKAAWKGIQKYTKTYSSV